MTVVLGKPLSGTGLSRELSQGGALPYYITTKSNCSRCSRSSGVTRILALYRNVIQRLEKPLGESTRALILVETKEKVLKMVALFKELGSYSEGIIGTHDKSDIDYHKNQISAGMDILIGTPNRINAMFSSAGFNMNTIKMFVIDDADILVKNRMDTIILRLSMSTEKTQPLFFCNQITPKLEILADKIMVEPLFFESEDE